METLEIYPLSLPLSGEKTDPERLSGLPKVTQQISSTFRRQSQSWAGTPGILSAVPRSFYEINICFTF